jgi:hypothetical protein
MKRGENNLRTKLAKVESDLAKKEVVLKRKIEEANLFKNKIFAAAGTTQPNHHSSPHLAVAALPARTASSPPPSVLVLSPGLPVLPASSVATNSPGFPRGTRSSSSFSLPPPPASISPPLPRGIVLATATRAQNRLSSAGGATTVGSSLVPPVPPPRPSTLMSGVVLRRKLEETVRVAQERLRKVEELEKRLRAREADMKLLQNLMAEKEALIASASASASANGLAQRQATKGAPEDDLEMVAKEASKHSASVDFSLIRDINSFFAETEADDQEKKADAEVRTETGLDHRGAPEHEAMPGDNGVSVATEAQSLPPPSALAVSPAPKPLKRTFSVKEEETLRSLEVAIEAARSKLQFGEERIKDLASAGQTEQDADKATTRRDELLAFLHLYEAGTEEDSHTAPADALPAPGVVDPSLTARVLFEMLLEARREQEKKDKEAALQRLQLAELTASLKTAQQAFKTIKQKAALSSTSSSTSLSAFGPSRQSFRSAASTSAAAASGQADAVTSSSTPGDYEGASPLTSRVAFVGPLADSSGSSVGSPRFPISARASMVSASSNIVAMPEVPSQPVASTTREAELLQQLEELRRDRDRLRDEVNRLAVNDNEKKEQLIRRDVPGVVAATSDNSSQGGTARRYSLPSPSPSASQQERQKQQQPEVAVARHQRRSHPQPPLVRPFLPAGKFFSGGATAFVGSSGGPRSPTRAAGQSPWAAAGAAQPSFHSSGSLFHQVPVLSPLQANVGNLAGTAASTAAASEKRKMFKAALAESVGAAAGRSSPYQQQQQQQQHHHAGMSAATVNRLLLPHARPPLVPTSSFASFRSANSTSSPWSPTNKSRGAPAAGGETKARATGAPQPPTSFFSALADSKGEGEDGTPVVTDAEAATTDDGGSGTGSETGETEETFDSPESFHGGTVEWRHADGDGGSASSSSNGNERLMTSSNDSASKEKR